jgi:hypothetical protein
MASLGDHGLAPLADHQLASLADPALAPLGDHEMASLDRSRIGSNEAITDTRFESWAQLVFFVLHSRLNPFDLSDNYRRYSRDVRLDMNALSLVSTRYQMR